MADERHDDDTLAMRGPRRARDAVQATPAATPGPPAIEGFRIGARLGDGGMGVVFEAHDLVLERKVALKLIHPGTVGSDKARARLVREAQALARLKHPNVVTVFEVGTAGDEVFVAMELVDGGTLRDWMRAPHGWREVVDRFCAIGRGLAAVHALGLVHRDVKPSNVLLDADGTPKLGDFGLVSSIGDLELEAPPVAPAGFARDLTTTGSVMGTPAYMAPEQIEGRRIDARADQYAFCVSLKEALDGPGGASASRVPARVRRVVARGLAREPADRFATMDALVAALARARDRRAGVYLAFAAPAALAIGLGAWMLARAPIVDEPCPAPSAELAAVWNPVRRDALALHARATDPSTGDARADRVAARADQYVARWSELHVQACVDTRVRAVQPGPVLDLRMRCLAHRLDALDDAITLVQQAATPDVLDHAADGLARLEPIDDCADATALLAASPRSQSPEVRAAIERIDDHLRRISTREHADALDGLADATRDALADARVLGHQPTLVKALAQRARVELDLGNHDAEAVLRELTAVAARAHDDRDEAFAWIRLFGVLADRDDLAEARALIPAASAAVLRAGDPVDLRADLLYEEGAAERTTDHAAAGLAEVREATALLEKAGGAQPSSPYSERYAAAILETAVLQHATGDLAGALVTFHRAIDIDRAIYGPDSSTEGYGWHDLGETFRREGRFDEAIAGFREAIRIRSARVGESGGLAESLSGLAQSLGELHRWPEARDAFERVIRLDRQTLPEGDALLDEDLGSYAGILSHLGRADEAAKIYDEIVPRLERSSAGSINLAITINNSADLSVERGLCTRAIGDYAHAAELFAAVAGKDTGYLVAPLVGEGGCYLDLGCPSRALAPLEHAAQLTIPGELASTQRLGRFFYGRALVESGVDPARGLIAARAARDAIAADVHADPDKLAELDRWLAAQKGHPAPATCTLP